MPDYKLDKGEAPEGFYATPTVRGCQGCAFDSRVSPEEPGGCGRYKECFGSHRRDGRSVIFKKKADT